MIYTSYFAISNYIPLKNKISIARVTPKWFAGNKYLALAPPWELVAKIKQDSDVEYYIKHYKNILMTLDASQVVGDLGKNPVLFCYEKPENFCHRQIVCKWLNYYGYECKEFKYND